MDAPRWQPTRRTRIFLILVAAAILFLVALIPLLSKDGDQREQVVEQQLMRITQLESELARTQVHRDLARAHGKLGLVLFELNRNNYPGASTRSTEFFDALRASTGHHAFTFAVPRSAPFQTMLSRRDEISGDLARKDPIARSKLEEMYLQFEQALQR